MMRRVLAGWISRRRRMGWGGSAWTEPIPIHPRAEGHFAMWPWRTWELAENTRTGEVLRIRADRSGKWAEIVRA